jgi:uncharacterized protein
MDGNGQDHTIATTEALESLYSDAPYGPAVIKETDHVTAEYRKLIEAAPFVVLATNGPEGLDCSPRGDPPGFVRVVDERTLLIPDRRGNNRIDSLRNLVRDPRLALPPVSAKPCASSAAPNCRPIRSLPKLLPSTASCRNACWW